MQTTMAKNSTAADQFRRAVCARLAERNTTITQLALDLGMGRSALSRFLHAKEDITFTRAEKIARYFRCDLAEMLNTKKKSRSAVDVSDKTH